MERNQGEGEIPCRIRSTRCGVEFISSCKLKSDRYEHPGKERIFVIPEYFGHVNLERWAGTVANGAVVAILQAIVEACVRGAVDVSKIRIGVVDGAVGQIIPESLVSFNVSVISLVISMDI